MTVRTPPAWIATGIAILLLAGCASSPEEETAENPDFGQGTVEASKAVARGIVDGGKAVGRGMSTAYRGMRDGFQTPEDEAAYGTYPKDYVNLVRKHFFRVLRYPDDTRFSFGRPTRGYMNQGIFRGGGVAWQGWLVDVDVETVQSLTKHRAERSYVVRIRNGEIIEVHQDASLLHRADPAPASRAR